MYLFCMKDILKFYSYHYKHLIRYVCFFFLCVMWNKNLNVYFLVIFTWIWLTMYINYVQNVFYIVWLVLKMLQLGNCRFFLMFIWWIEKWFYWERGVKKKTKHWFLKIRIKTWTGPFFNRGNDHMYFNFLWHIVMLLCLQG